MEFFTENDIIFKKKYILDKLQVDYSDMYVIKSIEKKKTTFGVSYLATINNINKRNSEEIFEICFVDYNNKNKKHIYAEIVPPSCVCC